MMQRNIKQIIFLFSVTIFMLSCGVKMNKETEVFTLDVMQINDVYEISPVENGKYGGMSRVATLIKNMKAQNENSFSVCAGDFLNPSVIGTLKYENDKIKGKQMIECMNAAGIDYVTLGNHEFDLKYHQLQKRINESNFEWLSSNAFHHTELGDLPFVKVVDGNKRPLRNYKILTYKTILNQEVKVGILSSTITSNKKKYVFYNDFDDNITKDYYAIKDSVDILIALTHLSLDEDKYLAEKLPEIDLILGGHEHVNLKHNIGYTRITKADANAKTAYHHILKMDLNTKELVINSNLVNVDESIIEDKACKEIENKWLNIARESFKKEGLDPDEVIGVATIPLDGREKNIRFKPTNLGALISKSMQLSASRDSTIVLVNSGSIRLDDQLSGSITQYDIIRTLPYGGHLVEVKIKGDLLQRVLDIGLSNAGNGGFLIREGVDLISDNTWSVNGEKLDPNKKYNLITTGYLISGNETNLSFFKMDHEGISGYIKPSEGPHASIKGDIRQAIIHYLKNRN